MLGEIAKLDLGELMDADFPLYDWKTVSVTDSENLIKFVIDRELDTLFKETGLDMFAKKINYFDTL